MVSRFLKLILMVGIFASLYSCATTDEMDRLDSSVRSYERAIRWGEFGQAKSFHKNEPELSDLERRRLQLYRISGYKVISNDTPNTKNSYIRVEIKYYRNDRPVIKAITVKQHWKRDEGSQLWYLATPFPEFR